MKELNRLVSGNLRAYYRHIARSCGYDTEARWGVEYFWNRRGGWPALVAGIPDPEYIPSLADAMARGEVPSFLVVDGEAGEEIRKLEEAGLRVFRRWKGMFLKAGDFGAQVQMEAGPAGMQMYRNRPEDLDELLQLVNRELMSAFPMGPEIKQALQSPLEQDSRGGFQWLLARIGGEAVAGGMLFSENGTAGLYNIVSHAGYRGKGIGSALVDGLVKMGLSGPNETLVLHSSAMGESIYRRLGFQELEDYHILIYLD